MADQGQVLINTETPLATQANVANVAVNQQAARERKAANVDGQEIFPDKVFTNDLVLKTALSVGSGVAIMDGTITSEMIGADQVNASHIYAEGLTTSDITFTGGALSEFGITTMGSIVGGNLSIADGVTIGAGGAGGFYIGNNQLICYDSGENPTIILDGNSGAVITKTAMTLDGTSTMDTRLASLTVGTGTIVGDGADTLGDIQNDASAAYEAVSDMADDTKITPTEKLVLNAEYERLQAEYTSLVSQCSTQGVADSSLDTAYNNLVTYIETTLDLFGDFDTNTTVNRTTWDSTWKAWYDAATAIHLALTGDAEGKADSAATAATNANTNADGRISATQSYIGFDTGQITEISTSGIAIHTGTLGETGARTYIDSNGIRCYNGTATISQMDHTNGFWVNNPSSTPGIDERYSVAFNGAEVGYFGAATSNAVWVRADYGTNHLLLDSVAGNVTVSAGTTIAISATTSLAITAYSGTTISGGDVEIQDGYLHVRSGVTSDTTYSIYDSGTVRIHGNYLVLQAAQTVEIGCTTYPGKCAVRGAGSYFQTGGTSGPKLWYKSTAPDGTDTDFLIAGSICMCGTGAVYRYNGSSWTAM